MTSHRCIVCIEVRDKRASKDCAYIKSSQHNMCSPFHLVNI